MINPAKALLNLDCEESQTFVGRLTFTDQKDDAPVFVKADKLSRLVRDTERVKRQKRLVNSEATLASRHTQDFKETDLFKGVTLYI